MSYGLIINHELICDPISDHARISAIATRHGFTVVPPFTEATSQTIAGRTLHIWPGVEQRPEQPAGHRGRLTGWQADPDNQQLVRTVEYTPLPADEFRAELETVISDKKWWVIEGGLMVNGVPIKTDARSRNDLYMTTQSVEAGRRTAVPWKSPKGFIDATAELLVPLRDAVEDHIQLCFERERDLYTDLDNAMKADDQHQALTSIDWESGWPATLAN